MNRTRPSGERNGDLEWSSLSQADQFDSSETGPIQAAKAYWLVSLKFNIMEVENP